MALKVPSLSIRYAVFTTWILWDNLLHPTDHPLFRRTLRLPAESPNLPSSSIAWMIPLLGAFACCSLWVLLIPLKSPLMVIVPITLIAASSSYVTIWVMRIAVTIARQKENRTYDQLCLPPGGALTATWALCAAALHRNDALGWIDTVRKVMTALLMFALLSILITTALRQNAPPLTEFLLLLLEMFIIAALSYVDHIHTLVLGSLAGMLASTQTSSTVDARIWGALIFLSLQTLTCLVTLFTPAILLPAFERIEAALNWNFAINPLIASLLAFYLTREALIALLWQALTRQLNANPLEFRFWD